MAISSILRRMPPYVGDGSASEFPITFKFKADADILAHVQPDGAAGILLVLNTDYTLDGAGDEEGGNLTLVDNGQAWMDGDFLATGYDLFIRGRMSIIQNTSIKNQKDFFPKTHEDVFDKLVMIDQQQQDEIDRSVKLPEVVSASDFDPTFPEDIVGSSEKIPITNVLGTGFKPAASWLTRPDFEAADAAAAAAQAAQAAAEAAQAASVTAKGLAQAAQAAAETAETNAASSQTAAAASAAAAAASAAAAAASQLGTPIQESVAGTKDGVNTAFTISQTPLNASRFRLYLNGSKLIAGTHFTRVGTAITAILIPDSDQDYEADYDY
jgi:hypothetical protein